MPWMVPARRAVALLCVFSLAAQSSEPAMSAPSAAGGARQVGDAGDLRRVVLEGVRTCDPLEVRRAMLLDLQLQAAARPSAPRDAFLETLEARLLEGFHHSGFADATVEASYNPATDAVTASIHEGRLYKRRDIRISGGSSAVRKELLRRLREPEGPLPGIVVAGDQRISASEEVTNAALWPRGTAAIKTLQGDRSLKPILSQLFDDLAYPDAKFTAAREWDRTAAACDLVVRIHDLGKRNEVASRGQVGPPGEQAASLARKPGDQQEETTLTPEQAEQHALLSTMCRLAMHASDDALLQELSAKGSAPEGGSRTMAPGVESAHPDRPSFSIPVELQQPPGRELSSTDQSRLRGLMAGPSAADLLFPRESWPWTLMREASFHFAGSAIGPDLGAGSVGEFRRVFAEQPLGPLAAQTLTASSSSGIVPEQCRKQLLQAVRRSQRRDAIQRDLQLVAYGNHGFARAVRFLCSSYSATSAKERKQLAARLPDAVVVALDMVAENQLAHPDQPIGQAIEESLAGAWGGGLSDWVDLAIRGAIRDSAIQPAGAEEPAILSETAATEKEPARVRQARGPRDEHQVK